METVHAEFIGSERQKLLSSRFGLGLGLGLGLGRDV
jgi:hypothetical protein